MEENIKKRKSRSTEIAFLMIFTLALGFFMGLIFAPKKGSKFRKELVERTKDIADRARFSLVEARVMGEELIEKSIGKVGEVSSKLRGNKESEEIE